MDKSLEANKMLRLFLCVFNIPEEATQVECTNKEAGKVTDANTSTTSWRNSSMISSKLIRLFLYLFNIPKACYLVEGVTISLALVEYGVLVVLMQYLTSVFKFSMVRAAGTVNIFYFVSGILAIFAEFCKLRVGCYFMVKVMCISYILALVVLLKNFPDPKSRSPPSQKSIQFLDGALFLLAVGRGVYISTCTKEFVGGQMKNARRISSKDNDRRDGIRYEISTIRAKIVGFGLANWFLNGKWIFQFKMSISILSCTTFCLFAWKIMSRMSSTTFRLLQSPEDEDDRSEHHLEAGNTKSKLSNNQQTGIVTSTSLGSVVPICFAFLMYGIVHSTGETFFQNQAENSNTSSMGSEKAALMTLQIIAKTTRFFVNHLVSRVLSGISRTGTLSTVIQMGLGMLFSVVTCSIARYTEVVRLAATKHSNCSVHKPCEIDVASFIPQFIALGFVTGLAGKGLENFLEGEYSNWIKTYATTIYEVLTGIGYVLSAGIVLILRSATKKLDVDGQGWFTETLNESRVDLYYHTLAVMCALNFIPLYALASTCYYRKIKIRKFLLEGMML